MINDECQSIIVKNKTDYSDCRCFLNAKLIEFPSYFIIKSKDIDLKFDNSMYYYVCHNTNSVIPSLDDLSTLVKSDDKIKNKLKELINYIMG